MQLRILTVYTVLIACLVTALAVPFSLAYSSHRTGKLLLERRADATRFSELADQAIRDGDTSGLRQEVSRYHELYRTEVEIRDRDGRRVAGGGAWSKEPAERALSGRTTAGLPLVTPFGPASAVVAEPVGRDAQVFGVVVMKVSTAAARRDVTLVWAAVAAGSMVAVLCALIAARRLARWILRPVTELDLTTRAIAEGRMDARVRDGGRGPAELRLLERRFNAMADAVSAALERQRAFVADASHELRTPLTVLSLRLENLEAHLTEDGTEEFAEALAEVDRLGRLMEDLLTLARVEAGTAAPEPIARATLRGRLAIWHDVYAARELTLTMELDATGPSAAPLPAAAARIADIALDNASKFVPPGGTVTVRLDRGVLRIADDGPGLEPEQLEAALGRFWRSPGHGNVPGSGLGLAIASELARAADCELSLRPATPHGLVVELRLPEA
ncbi:HAMP domain-containing sensor histidine kinase [Streptomyces sp. ME19-01-6]|uniref:sensor histidine kinase n=1 Tax=Streptomyces sp. ME19-01-6 TaxID=3028686 RepID=UPI0029A5F866|nr:HAMP domain-containing sensor histidine kinase [Streptomyces sp. ME19-01-6]MDX3230500.1 HAMP domain-containing sensor histidine kinase [Streptomyces sp. ME19-01-6]